MSYEPRFHQIIDLEYKPPNENYISHYKKERERLKKHCKDISKEVPEKVGGVYYLMNEYGQVHYVGRTENFIQRLHSHIHCRRLGVHTYKIALQFIDNIPDQNITEAVAIKEFMPVNNVTGKTI